LVWLVDSIPRTFWRAELELINNKQPTNQIEQLIQTWLELMPLIKSNLISSISEIQLISGNQSELKKVE